MEDIYPILAKHFLGQATSDEELLVTQFKQKNNKEYTLLKAVWHKQDISINEFDTQNAWETFIANRKKKQTKVLPLFGNVRNIAAAVALLILCTATALYFTTILPKSNVVLVKNANAPILKKELEDGSIVWLNNGATIAYPEKFETKSREVSLTGEAFFEVAKEEKRPFMVSSSHSIVTVLGTSFNIDNNPQRTRISVRTGKVEVASKSRDEKAIVLPDQSVLVNKDDFLKSDTVDTNYLSWKTGIFEFKDTPILQVVARLNSYYQDSLSIDPSKTYNCNLSAKFDRVPLHEVLKILEVTCGVSIEKLGDVYTIQ